MDGYLVTAESVTEGHPDKICDQISDGILDEYLVHDPNARVAVETLISKNTVVIAGEITANVTLDVATIARSILKEIGYIEEVAGLDFQKCMILTNINNQSPDIALGVQKENEQLGAGDQGIIYGYASDETENFMPLPIELAHEISKQLAKVRKNGSVWWLYPDGKSQVTVKYNDQGHPLYIDSIVLSAQHRENIENGYLHDVLMEDVLYRSIGQYITNETRIHINPTGRFIVGGPAADTGLTGRKIMVDTYGGIARHGGGAFSGKDATKVDRSAAYMARYVAKNIVAAKLAKRCEVSIAYAIGKEEPEAITINTFQTEEIDLRILQIIVDEVFSFKPIDIIKQLDLCRPRFKKTATYGHFGRQEKEFTWERLDKVPILKEMVSRIHTNSSLK